MHVSSLHVRIRRLFRKGMSVEERKKVRAEGGLEKLEPHPYYESILSMLASGVTEMIILSQL